MKIRQGFVSNSSSASFVVTVPRPKAEVLELLGKQLDCTVSRENLLESMRERLGVLEEAKRDAEARDRKQRPWGNIIGEMRERHIDKMRAKIAEVAPEETPLPVLIEAYLGWNGVEITGNGRATKLVAHTTMLNDLTDMPEAMRTVLAGLVVARIPCDVVIDTDNMEPGELGGYGTPGPLVLPADKPNFTKEM